MAGEKYIIVTPDIPVHVNIRNILNPCGFYSVAECQDSGSMIRALRTLGPEFVVVDTSLHQRELVRIVETIDTELLCPIIMIGSQSNGPLEDLAYASNLVFRCANYQRRDVFANTVEMALISCRRIVSLERKLRMTEENYESRKLVDRAKWILIERDHIGETEAYERMRRKSMDSRMSMKQIAEAIIFTYEISQKK